MTDPTDDDDVGELLAELPRLLTEEEVAGLVRRVVFRSCRPLVFYARGEVEDLLRRLAARAPRPEGPR